jgi:hypothetical protein
MNVANAHEQAVQAALAYIQARAAGRAAEPAARSSSPATANSPPPTSTAPHGPVTPSSKPRSWWPTRRRGLTAAGPACTTPSIYEHAKTAGYIYEAQLRHELTRGLGSLDLPAVPCTVSFEQVDRGAG